MPLVGASYVGRCEQFVNNFLPDTREHRIDNLR